MLSGTQVGAFFFFLEVEVRTVKSHIRWEYICKYNGEHVLALYVWGKFMGLMTGKRAPRIDSKA